MKEDTIPEMFFNRVEKYRNKTALKVKYQGKYKEITWTQFGLTVKRFAIGLINLGVTPQENVALLSENRPEWAYTDLAIMSSAGITVPIYPTLSTKQIEYIINDAGCRTIIVSTQQLLGKLIPIISQSEQIKKTIIIDEIDGIFNNKYYHTEIISWNSVMLIPYENRDRIEDELNHRIKNTKSDDVATIVYTSGTTGNPKGVMLTHRNFLSNCKACKSFIPVGEDDDSLSFLPLSHVFERMAGYYMLIYSGATIAYAESIEKVPENILEVRPTVLLGVPRFYEKFQTMVLDTVRNKPMPIRIIFNLALKVGKRRASRILEKRRVSIPLKICFLLCDNIFFKKIKEAMGGRLRFFISGGAPLGRDLAEFFYSLGFTLLEGYGLTETSPVVSCNTPDKTKLGTVGMPIPKVEVKTSEEGEILIKGENVMRGYYRMPLDTEEVIKDGWFYTGDIGFIDKDGFLSIVDRKKDIIVTSGGKNISPQNIENLLKADEYISEAIIFGDRRNYIIALIVPVFESLEKFAKDFRIDFKERKELLNNYKIRELISERIALRLKDLSKFEQVKRFALIDGTFTIESGELTPTLKLKRDILEKRYKELINSLYN